MTQATIPIFLGGQFSVPKVDNVETVFNPSTGAEIGSTPLWEWTSSIKPSSRRMKRWPSGLKRRLSIELASFFAFAV